MASEPLCGGVSEDLDIHNKEHAERIQTALATASDRAGKAYKLHRVEKQVVAGMLYTYYISFNDGESGQKHKITVWERPWLKEKDPEAALRVTFEVHKE